MLIGIISDTHDNIENTKRAFRFFNESGVGLVLHCGDWVAPFMLEASLELDCPIRSVFGNNEGDTHPYYELIKKENLDITLSDEGVWEGVVSGRNVAITHGHQPIILKLLLDSGKYDLVASGHTHMACIEWFNNTLHVNPGSVMGAKRLELKGRFSVAVYNTSSGEAEIKYFSK
ncbi:MAG: metallophosphoesterase [Nanobdellota archaeon]